MKVVVNWLPSSLTSTRAVARRVESLGFFGLGVCDSPHYDELYASCEAVLDATERLVVMTSVTNPVTRHWSLHASAVRTFAASSPNRFRLGLGTGDSAVRTDGGKPATLGALATAIERIKSEGPASILVAASGPRGTRLAFDETDGLIAGVGTDLELLGARRSAAPTDRPFEVWASVRCTVRDTDAEVADARRSMKSRAISAGRFNLASSLADQNIPEDMHEVMVERFARYDFSWHGRTKDNPNAALFLDRPDVEEFLIDRYAIIGRPDQVRDQFRALATVVDGIILSPRFESVDEEIDRIGEALAPLWSSRG